GRGEDRRGRDGGYPAEPRRRTRSRPRVRSRPAGRHCGRSAPDPAGVRPAVAPIPRRVPRQRPRRARRVRIGRRTSRPWRYPSGPGPAPPGARPIGTAREAEKRGGLRSPYLMRFEWPSQPPPRGGGGEKRTMGKKLFVGNLSFDTTSADLEALFAQIGSCESAAVITDRTTGRSRGFGFVEMSSSGEAEKAIAELNGK